MNPCLRPASLSDVVDALGLIRGTKEMSGLVFVFLESLYDAEWRLRGFERSP